MQGTEKQVKWAMTIRAEKMEIINLRLNDMSNRLAEKPVELAKVEALRQVLADKSAVYWIDNREVHGLDIMRVEGKKILQPAA